MMYVLTQAEYTALVSKPEQVKKELTGVINQLCQQVATHKPILFWDREEPEPWGCIRNEVSHGYCDECPVSQTCTHPKEWSK